jgi:N-acetylmuramoyl-L-alanine amidase
MKSLPSPNHDSRNGTPISMLVFHYTGMTSGEAALSRLCDPAAKVSAHYTIDEDGTVYGHVPEDRRAWHAGLAFWGGVRDVNAHSIGIELVNPGNEFGYRPFPPAQIAALKKLSLEILKRHTIPAWNVVGHSDVAPARKDDPGELFPWQDFAEDGIGLWPIASASAVGAEALLWLGYDPDASAEKRIIAFQRHFRPEKLSGLWDDECGHRLAGILLAKASAS